MRLRNLSLWLRSPERGGASFDRTVIQDAPPSGDGSYEVCGYVRQNVEALRLIGRSSKMPTVWRRNHFMLVAN